MEPRLFRRAFFHACPVSHNTTMTHLPINLRLARAKVSLHGLSVGDAFGQQFFTPGILEACIERRAAPPPKWHYTDDTEMALAIVEVLATHAHINQDDLARRFAQRWESDPMRGYGAGTRRVLQSLSKGRHWREAVTLSFGQEGSYGNGGAMRVAPVGAFHCDDQELVIRDAIASAEITHGHPEALAGAIAVAVAAAWCCNHALPHRASGAELLDAVIDQTPSSATRDAINKARSIPLDAWEFTASSLLGNGSQITSVDTVPFALWCVAANLDSYPNALWAAARIGGDSDTNCAIVGGIVACRVGEAGIPSEWLTSREELHLQA